MVQLKPIISLEPFGFVKINELCDISMSGGVKQSPFMASVRAFVALMVWFGQNTWTWVLFHLHLLHVCVLFALVTF